MVARLSVCFLIAGLALSCGGETATRPLKATPTARPATAVAPQAATGTATAASAVANPADLFRAFVDAINRGSVEAALTAFAANATWERGGQCPPGRCSGLERIRQEIERDVANHHRIDITSIEAAAGTVRARVELRTDQTRARQAERIVQVFTVTVVDGKFGALVATNDVTDATTAAFLARGQ